MWHILEAYNRRVARKVDPKYANYLYEKQGGRLTHSHSPHYWGDLSGPIEGTLFKSNQEQPPKPLSELLVSNIIGYVTNAKPLYTQGCIAVIADGIEICRVTRKQDAFRIMTALKRDYKDIVVCAVL